MFKAIDICITNLNNMSLKDSKLYSIASNKCPHCHEGNFFTFSNPYKLERFMEMNQRCGVCNEDFRREPGYYFGAMYVSYALTVGLGVLLYLLMCVGFSATVTQYFVSFIVLLIVLIPIFYRTARLIWINFFVRYEKPIQVQKISI
jgi:uncharacterized protein (DUF983 family)